MLIQKQDCIMEIDLERTREYNRSHSLCDCSPCRNYCAQVKERFPLLAAFLLEFGVSIDRPDEINYLEADNEIQYLFAAHTVCGSILESDKWEMTLHDGGLLLNIVIDNTYVPNEQKTDYFVITVGNLALPWVLNEPLPQAETKQKVFLRKLKALFSKSN